MNDNTESEHKESNEEREILLEIGRITRSSGSVDSGMTVLLARLLSNRQDSFSYGEASIFMASARSLPQRQDLVRRMYELRCTPFLTAKKSSNEYRAAQFAQKLMNLTFESVNKNRWYRNLAAHGTFYFLEDVYRIAPSPLDIVEQKTLASRGNAFKFGLSIDQLKTGRALVDRDQNLVGMLGQVFWGLLEAPFDTKYFLQQANELARQLKLQALKLQNPSDGRPMRSRRERKEK